MEYHRSFGELSPLVKSHLSHRSRAAARIVPRLIELFDARRNYADWIFVRGRK